MLTTHDVATLFQSMRAVYGSQWSHQGPETVEVWRRTLHDFDGPEIMGAANRSLDFHKDYPPSLPQFKDLCKLARRSSVPQISHQRDEITPAKITANRALLGIIRNINGVDRVTLKNLVGLKNALADEHGPGACTEEYVDSLCDQLEALAANHDQEGKAREVAAEKARR